MKQRFFVHCETLEDLKKEYHRLARKYHPDNGGDAEIMKQINSEFDFMHGMLKNTHRKANGEKWTAQKESKVENKEAPEEYREMIDMLIHYNVLIEFIGCYIWVTGDTKPIKEVLKRYGFQWSHKKEAWYLKPENYKPLSRKNWSMQDIRNTFGVQASYQGTKEERKEYERIRD